MCLNPIDNTINLQHRLDLSRTSRYNLLERVVEGEHLERGDRGRPELLGPPP